MKKVIKIALIIFLAISMLFVLTGCGKDETKVKEKDSIELSNAEELKDEDILETKVKFSIGEWNDGVYTNDFLGLKFSLPEGWTYSSDKELARDLNNGLELLNEYQREMVEKAVEKSTGLYYLQAKEPITNDNVIVFTEKMPEGISEEYYLQQVGKQLSAIESVNYNIGQIEEETISNKEYTTLQVEIEGYGILQKYYTYIRGDYAVGIIITSTTGEELFDEIIRRFE